MTTTPANILSVLATAADLALAVVIVAAVVAGVVFGAVAAVDALSGWGWA